MTTTSGGGSLRLSDLLAVVDWLRRPPEAEWPLGPLVPGKRVLILTPAQAERLGPHLEPGTWRVSAFLPADTVLQVDLEALGLDDVDDR